MKIFGILYRFLAIALVAATLGGSAHSENRENGVIGAEKALLALVNEARSARNLPELRWNPLLAAAALRHAQVMAEHGTAQHEFDGEPDLRARVKRTGMRFSSLSENVTQGPTPDFIHSQFMHSSPHRANILDVDMNSAAIGVVEKRGQLFAVEDFSRTQ